jgi:hypothetical protein
MTKSEDPGKRAELEQTVRNKDPNLTEAKIEAKVEELQMQQFSLDIKNFNDKHDKTRRCFLCKFYSSLAFEIVLDVIYLIVNINDYDERGEITNEH